MLLVSIRYQSMALVVDGEVLQEFPVSTSKNPPSFREGSFGTPWGLHAAADKIGADQPSGMVFKGRVPTGRLFKDYDGPEAASSLITSRIIRLRGLEPGVNSGPGIDTYDRYVYIHGTNHEDRIGTPASAGCVQLNNADMIDLFDRVEENDLVWITR